ncbi:MAG: hypothetical protein H6907_10220 [Hyphomicrobiales bacterium]|nr:hypothetical protein [Hyphomicrobiales bacterium]MCP5372094.1 hypothetical protein [Hyphomicrobiales bacterium]
MASTPQETLAQHRRRMKRQGFVRLEVRVRRQDAALVRDLVGALDDPARADEARALLRARFGARAPKGLKALLASAPLDGVDLERDLDRGRDVDLS